MSNPLDMVLCDDSGRRVKEMRGRPARPTLLTAAPVLVVEKLPNNINRIEEIVEAFLLSTNIIEVDP